MLLDDGVAEVVNTSCLATCLCWEIKGWSLLQGPVDPILGVHAGHFADRSASTPPLVGRGGGVGLATLLVLERV